MRLTKEELNYLKDHYERLEPIYQKVLDEVYDLRSPLGENLEERKKVAALFEKIIRIMHAVGQPKGEGLDTTQYE